MWFIGVEVEQEMSADPPKKNPGSAPDTLVQDRLRSSKKCARTLLRKERVKKTRTNRRRWRGSHLTPFFTQCPC